MGFTRRFGFDFGLDFDFGLGFDLDFDFGFDLGFDLDFGAVASRLGAVPFSSVVQRTKGKSRDTPPCVPNGVGR